MFFTNQAFANAWTDYKEKYLSDEGAIIDTGNKNMSHSEGQSYGLMFAVCYNDKKSFDKILKWTYDNLYDKKTGLFIWAYRRDGGEAIADRNNASDGDLMIANALFMAADKWGVADYSKKAESLSMHLLSLTITKYGSYNVVLPGANSFFYDNYVIINPSYFIYPAFANIYKKTYLKQFSKLITDGKRMLTDMKNLKVKLPPDWVKLTPTGEMIPAEQWPPRSSYDAIRVPLYLYWENKNAKELELFRNWYSKFPENSTPAWVNVETGQSADYFMSSGLKSVRDLVMGKPIPEPDIKRSEDYYNASLSMLVYLAFTDQNGIAIANH
ncbi:MAG: glycosyl hydrolase family 8 [Succinivibrio sp.]